MRARLFVGCLTGAAAAGLSVATTRPATAAELMRAADALPALNRDRTGARHIAATPR